MYTVHPDDLVRIVLGIEDAGEDLVAIFHSHTHTPAVPSPTDRREAQYPDVFYLLATLSDPDASGRGAPRVADRGGREPRGPVAPRLGRGLSGGDIQRTTALDDPPPVAVTFRPRQEPAKRSVR